MSGHLSTAMVFSNWKSLSNGEKSGRKEVWIASQATGSVHRSEAIILETDAGLLKLMRFPELLHYHKNEWYPPPGHRWDYATFTVECGEPPSLDGGPVH